MTRASFAALATALTGGVGIAILPLLVRPMGLALLLMLPTFIVTSMVAGGLFRRLATPAEIQDDLEERVRNPS